MVDTEPPDPTAAEHDPGSLKRLRTVPRTVVHLWRLLPNRPLLLSSSGLAVLMSLSGVAGAHFIRGLVDAAIARDAGAALGAGLLLGGITGLESLLGWSERRLFGRFSERAMADIRARCGQRLVSVSPAFHVDKHTSDHVSRLTNDMAAVQELASENLRSLVRQPLAAVGALAYLGHLDWQLTVLVFCLMPVLLAVGERFSRPISSQSRAFYETLSAAAQVAQDSISGVEVIRIFGAENLMARRYRREVDESVRSARALARSLAVLWATSGAMALLPYLVVFGIGGYRVVQGVMTAGSLLAFVELLNLVAWPTSEFPNLIGRIRRNLAAAARVFEVMDLPTERAGGIMAGSSAGGLSEVAINCSGLEFSYPGRQNPVLSGLSFEVRRGETVALVGPSGCGKSTVLKLLLGFYDCPAGELRVLGTHVVHWDLTDLRRQIAYVQQVPYLFPGTIRDNLLCGREAVSDEHMVAAARAVGVHDFVLSLPDGYETEVGELGARLSAGQRQRMAIARALLKDATVLLLDEATSNLDAESERSLLEGLRELLHDRTCLIVAHRLSGLRTASRFLVMDNGTVVESGTHKELLDRAGLYARLYREQSHPLPAPGGGSS
ncbi:MAG: ABC transporter ATP-binding protein [Bacillota bacterium]